MPERCSSQGSHLFPTMGAGHLGAEIVKANPAGPWMLGPTTTANKKMDRRAEAREGNSSKATLVAVASGDNLFEIQRAQRLRTGTLIFYMRRKATQYTDLRADDDALLPGRDDDLDVPAVPGLDE